MPEISSSKYLVVAGWDDVPHLDAKTKAELLASTPDYLQDARSKGIPSLGAGAVYPIAEADFIVNDFPIPDYWPRSYGLDVGWKRTAAAFGAYDISTDTVYIVSEYYRGQSEPTVHAAAILAKGGDWQYGAIDPASNGASQHDGKRLMQSYKSQGLKLVNAKNDIYAGTHEIHTRLTTGRLKVFKSCSNWLDEFRLYSRDEHGKINKENDHLMDATRYYVMSGLKLGKTKIVRATHGARRHNSVGY